MTVLNFPSIAIYLTGHNYSNFFLRTTLAGLFTGPDDDSNSGGGHATFLLGMGLPTAASVVAWWDVVVVVFYVLSTLWLARSQYIDSVLFDILGTTLCESGTRGSGVGAAPNAQRRRRAVKTVALRVCGANTSFAALSATQF